MNKELEILETLEVIMGRLDDIEEKINIILSNADPYDLKDYLSQNNEWTGYTMIDST